MRYGAYLNLSLPRYMYLSYVVGDCQACNWNRAYGVAEFLVLCCTEVQLAAPLLSVFLHPHYPDTTSAAALLPPKAERSYRSSFEWYIRHT